MLAATLKALIIHSADEAGNHDGFVIHLRDELEGFGTDHHADMARCKKTIDAHIG